MASSTGLQSQDFNRGLRWLTYRSRHCLPVRSFMDCATRLHFMGMRIPCTMVSRSASSSLVHVLGPDFFLLAEDWEAEPDPDPDVAPWPELAPGSLALSLLGMFICPGRGAGRPPEPGRFMDRSSIPEPGMWLPLGPVPIIPGCM